MDIDERERGGRPIEDRSREAAAERAREHMLHEMRERSQLREQAYRLAVPDPEERAWDPRSDENVYFARQDAAIRREMLEVSYLRSPALMERSFTRSESPFVFGAIAAAEERIGRLQGRGFGATIFLFDGKSHQLGYFKSEEYAIGINRELFEAQQTDRILDVYLHEARHAFQWHVINYPSAHPEMHPSVIQAWTDAKSTLVVPRENATDAEIRAYENHPLEVDARGYSERQRDRHDEQREAYLAGLDR